MSTSRWLGVRGLLALVLAASLAGCGSGGGGSSTYASSGSGADGGDGGGDDGGGGVTTRRAFATSRVATSGGDATIALGETVDALGDAISSTRIAGNGDLTGGVGGLVSSVGTAADSIGNGLQDGLGQLDTNPNALGVSVAGVTTATADIGSGISGVGTGIKAFSRSNLARQVPVVSQVDVAGGLVRHVGSAVEGSGEVVTMLGDTLSTATTTGVLSQATETLGGEAVVPVTQFVEGNLRQVGSATGLGEPLNAGLWQGAGLVQSVSHRLSLIGGDNRATHGLTGALDGVGTLLGMSGGYFYDDSVDGPAERLGALQDLVDQLQEKLAGNGEAGDGLLLSLKHKLDAIAAGVKDGSLPPGDLDGDALASLHRVVGHVLAKIDAGDLSPGDSLPLLRGLDRLAAQVRDASGDLLSGAGNNPAAKVQRLAQQLAVKIQQAGTALGDKDAELLANLQHVARQLAYQLAAIGEAGDPTALAGLQRVLDQVVARLDAGQLPAGDKLHEALVGLNGVAYSLLAQAAPEGLPMPELNELGFDSVRVLVHNLASGLGDTPLNPEALSGLRSLVQNLVAQGDMPGSAYNLLETLGGAVATTGSGVNAGSGNALLSALGSDVQQSGALVASLGSLTGGSGQPNPAAGQVLGSVAQTTSQVLTPVVNVASGLTQNVGSATGLGTPLSNVTGQLGGSVSNLGSGLQNSAPGNPVTTQLGATVNGLGNTVTQVGGLVQGNGSGTGGGLTGALGGLLGR